MAASGLSVAAGCLEGDDDGSEPNTTPADPSLPVEVRTVEAPGSEAGTTTVPPTADVLVVAFVRTLCPTSERTVATLADGRTALGDDADELAFLTVVDATVDPNPDPAGVADWWAEHGGDWPVGIDEDGSLNEHYDVRSFPVVIAIAPDGEARWRHSGDVSASTVTTRLEGLLEADRE